MKKSFLVALLSFLLFVPLSIVAQNVTVKPSSGSMIAAVPENISGTSGDYDTFYRRGGFATWRHNQLCLTMTTSDAPGLTSNGMLANPANNLYGRTSTNEIEMGRGANDDTRNCYMILALPKGYRFTGYEIVFSRNKNDFGNNDNYYYNTTNNPNTNGTTRFGETDASFNYLSSEYYKDVTYNASATLENGSETITHEDADNMSNVLYFRLTDANTGTGRMVVTFHSITLWFTAEENYTPVLPQAVIETPVSAVDIPFATGKVDYGSIERRYYNGQSRVSYSSANVIDMTANMTLYEFESVKDGQTHFDGTTGKVVDYKDGTIFNYGDDWFRLGKTSGEQVYFIESPTYVVLPDENHTKNPVGFRIVGAELEYQVGASQPAVETSTTHYYITYISGGSTYYLDETGKFVTGTKTEWSLDANNYAHCGDVYLTYSNSGNSYYLALGNITSQYKMRLYNGKLLLSNGRNYYSDTYLQGNTTGTTPLLSETSENDALWTTETETTTVVPAYTPGSFKLKVYDKEGNLSEIREISSDKVKVFEADGTTLKDQWNVSEAGYGKVTLTGLNNDAVKFGIEGVGFVKGNLTMQALDPYIDKMSVVCQDQEQTAIRITQTFEANDFSVSGGKFYFFLPTGCNNHTVKISYEDLWSHYADESYEGGSEDHYSRFNFVKSEHYNQFTSDNIYNNIAEAKAGKSTVHERQKVTTVGTKAFKFNNADQMQTTGGTLTEYPFTQANYAASPNSGSFYQMEYTVSPTESSKTGYVFTTDETRYNIAPTTAVQHRTYAFYTMEVVVKSETYTPKVEIVTVYDHTCVEKNGQPVDKPYYGAVITAPYGNPVKAGYASDKDVQDALKKVIDNQKDDFGHTFKDADGNSLLALDQILYLDLSGLAGYYVNDQHAMTLAAYRSTQLAKNALVFFPKGVTTPDPEDNFAYMTNGGNFRAAHDIVLTDKQPFYTPYDIQMPSQNKVTYTRLASAQGQQLVRYATIMMPFTLEIDENGIHTNEDGSKFMLREMKGLTVNAIEDVGNFYQEGDGYFEPIKPIDGNLAAANRPYMVEVLDDGGGSNYSFIATQAAKDIKKTPTSLVGVGETVTTSGSSGGFTLTNKGTYGGLSIPKGNNVFYFNRNKYVSSLNLSNAYTHVYVQPFRAYYDNPTPGAKAMSLFNILYEDYIEPFEGIATGVRELRKPTSFMVETGKNVMVIAANANVAVTVASLNGTVIAQTNMKAGEQLTLNVPTGIYMVNKTKVIVK